MSLSLNSMVRLGPDSPFFMVALLGLLLFSACAGGSRGNFKEVQFQAPSQPDPALRPFLKDVARIGVVCVTTIEPFRELDIEKVMARLANAVARGLGNMPRTTIVPQDEITWQLKETKFDSSSVYSDTVRAALRSALELDALVFVELQHLQARLSPVTPTPYGLVPNPGMDLTVDLRVSLINLHTAQVWQQGGQQRNFQPIRLQLLGGDNQSERQLLMALGRPLQRFLMRVAPPPRTQLRHFELSGD